MSSPSQRPLYRDWISANWKAGGTNGERWEQERNYAQLALEIAIASPGKLQDLLGRLAHLPEQAFNSILEILAGPSLVQVAEPIRLQLWQKLVIEARRHRRFSDTNWALPPEVVARIEKAAELIEPKTPQVRLQYLFNFRDFDFYDTEDYEAETKRIAEERRKAVESLLPLLGPEGILNFAREVAVQDELGYALGAVPAADVDAFLLPAYLQSEDGKISGMVAAFTASRYFKRGLAWLSELPIKDWTPEQIGIFYSKLPFTREVWESAEQALGEHANEYWRHVNALPRGTPDELLVAAEKLLSFNRGFSALGAVQALLHSKHSVEPQLVLRVLRTLLSGLGSDGRFDQYQVYEALKYLQNRADANQEELCQIEWLLLPMLGRLHDRSAAALERKLAAEPSFFVEIIASIYRPKNEPENPEASPEDEQRKQNVVRGYTLLRSWQTPPGMTADGTFDPSKLNAWIAAVRERCEPLGRWEVAQTHIGHVLVYAKTTEGDLWVNRDVAAILDLGQHDDMRRGFRMELFNSRGVYFSSHGKVERTLSADYQAKAAALDAAGFVNFAATMRGLAESYILDAEREEKRDPHDN
jgi:hypothetical protein